jgi:predicted metal-binding membrane protein
MGIWVTMMAAMLLPSAVPAVAMFAGLRPGAPSWAFVLGYQLTPLKNACLRHCRAPLGSLLRGRTGAVLTGLGHGAYCIGCCAGLMLALFALGVMSLVWMAAVAAVILVEKVLPRGEAFAREAAIGLVAAGVWVAVAPGSVPGLTEPGGAGMTPMQMEESP